MELKAYNIVTGLTLICLSVVFAFGEDPFPWCRVLTLAPPSHLFLQGSRGHGLGDRAAARRL